MYICQCYFLNSSHPLLPPLCPQVHSLCLCLHSLPAIGLSVPFSRVHSYALNIWYLFFSDLLYSVWRALDPATSLPLAQIHSFLWLSNIPLFIHNHTFFIHDHRSTPMSLLTSSLLICSFHNQLSVLLISVHWKLFRGFSASLWFLKGSVKTLQSLSDPPEWYIQLWRLDLI